MELGSANTNTQSVIPQLIVHRDKGLDDADDTQENPPLTSGEIPADISYTPGEPMHCNFSKTCIPQPADLVKPNLTSHSIPFYVVTQGCEVGVFEAYQIAHLPVGTFNRLSFERFHLWQDCITYYRQEFEDGNIKVDGSSFIHGTQVVEVPAIGQKKYATSLLAAFGSTKGSTRVFRRREIVPTSPDLPTARVDSAVSEDSSRYDGPQIIVHGDSDDTDLIPGPRYPERHVNPVRSIRGFRGTRSDLPIARIGSTASEDPFRYDGPQIIVYGDSDDTDLIPGPRYPKRRVNPVRSIRGTRRTSQPFIAPASSNIPSSPTPFIINDSQASTPPAPSSPLHNEVHSDLLPTTPIRQTNNLQSIIYPESYDSDEAITEAQLHEGSLRRLSIITTVLTVETPMSPLDIPSDDPSFVADGATIATSVVEAADMHTVTDGIGELSAPRFTNPPEDEDIFDDISEYDVEIYDELYAKIEPKPEATMPTM